MIEKITFKSRNKNKEYLFSKVNFLHSKNSNQAGKTTLLESISSQFLFNTKYANKQLNYTENEDIINSQIFTVINGKEYTVERIMNKHNKYEYSDEITEVSTNKKIKKEQLEDGAIIDWPKGYRVKAIYSNENTYKDLEANSFSFGTYYQMFYIDEKIGWNKYDQPKVLNAYNDYNKYNINIYLFSMIQDDSLISDSFDKFIEIYSYKNNSSLSEVLKNRNVLRSFKGAYEANAILNALKTDKNKDSLIIIGDKISKCEIKILNMKLERKTLRHSLAKENAVNDLFNRGIEKMKGSFGNAFEIMDIVSIENNTEKNIKFIEGEINNLTKQIKEEKRNFKELTRELTEEIKKIEEAKKKTNDLEENLSAIAYQKIYSEKNRLEKFDTGDEREKIYKYIKKVFISKNKKLINNEEVKIIRELKEELNNYDKKDNFNKKALERVVEQLEALEKNVFDEEYFAKGAFENIHILIERLSIVRLWKKKLPLMIIDSPMKGEIEEKQTNENPYRFLVILLINKFIQNVGWGKIDQLFISSASISDDREKIENFVNINIKNLEINDSIEWIDMEGIYN